MAISGSEAHHWLGPVWHVAHRCFKQEFLLKFSRDRRLGRYWLYEARQRYGLCVLDDMITSPRVHLLVRHVGRARWRVTSWT